MSNKVLPRDSFLFQNGKVCDVILEEKDGKLIIAIVERSSSKEELKSVISKLLSML